MGILVYEFFQKILKKMIGKLKTVYSSTVTKSTTVLFYDFQIYVLPAIILYLGIINLVCRTTLYLCKYLLKLDS